MTPPGPKLTVALIRQPARGGDTEMPNSALSLMRELNYDPRIGRVTNALLFALHPIMADG